MTAKSVTFFYFYELLLEDKKRLPAIYVKDSKLSGLISGCMENRIPKNLILLYSYVFFDFCNLPGFGQQTFPIFNVEVLKYFYCSRFLFEIGITF